MSHQMMRIFPAPTSGSGSVIILWNLTTSHKPQANLPKLNSNNTLYIFYITECY